MYLDGTGSSDSDGTIASYAWTQTQGETVTLSDPTASQPSFVAPLSAGTATFELRVTDNDGAQSTPDSVLITWSAAPTELPTSDWYELLKGDAVGQPVTSGNADFDYIDTGWTFDSPIAAGSGAMTITATGGVLIATHNFDGGSINVCTADAIFVIENLANGPYYIMRAVDGSTLRATVRVNTDGSVVCRNNITAVGTPTTALVASGEPFRVAWQINNTTTDQYARVYTGANLFGGETGFALTSGNYDQGTVDRIGFGIAPVAASSGDITVSTLQINESATWPDPYGEGLAQQISELYEMQDDGTWAACLLDILT